MAAVGLEWKPYVGAFMECPYLRTLGGSRCESTWEAWWALRWKLLWPMHTHFCGTSWTVGEVTFWIFLAGLTGWGAGAWNRSILSGKPVDLAGGLVFATAMRNSIFTLLLGLPFERALFYHKTLGLAAVILGLWHGFVALYFCEKCPMAEKQGYNGRRVTRTTLFSEVDNISGIIINCMMFVTCLVASAILRRRFFEFFHRCHIICSAACLGLAIWHKATMTSLGGCFWVVDLILFYVTAYCGCHGARSSEATALRLPADIVQISFPRHDFMYKGGQYVFLCVKALGPQFHPFSFSSSPHDDQVSIHIRVLGNWTKQLYDLVSKLESKSAAAKLEIYFDGPYGAPAVDVDGNRYKSFVMISGGNGITPMQSIWREILQQHMQGRPLKLMLFMWSVADRFMLSTPGLAQQIVSTNSNIKSKAGLTYNSELYKQLVQDNEFLPRSFQPPLNPMAVAADVTGPAWPARNRVSEFQSQAIGATEDECGIERHVSLCWSADHYRWFRGCAELASSCPPKMWLLISIARYLSSECLSA